MVKYFLTEEEKLFNKRCNLILFITVLLVISWLGTSLNYNTMIKNGGLMPVYSSYLCEKYDVNIYIDDEHFLYCSKEDVNLWYLADNTKLFNYIISLGDMILYPCIILFIFSMSLFVENETKLVKLLKKRKIKV
jgi:hypothetical protein